jgi:hypothetical protein
MFDVPLAGPFHAQVESFIKTLKYGEMSLFEYRDLTEVSA